MSNAEHLAIIKQGVEVWNEWRADNPNEVIDLSKANLISTDLSSANLTHTILKGADLRGADLRDGNLHGANLYGADLTHANLRGANLEAAILIKAVLKGAILERVDLSGANLERTNLEGADLKGANLRGANLIKSVLAGANLSESFLYGAELGVANLSDANLELANLCHANLMEAILKSANFRGVDLRSANLWGAYFIDADLEGANLLHVKALYTNFQGAALTSACIQDWHLNAETNLNGVICDYVYLKWWEKNEFRERRPHTGTFAPGEFAKLVQSTLDTIDLIFREGLDWKAFAYSFKQVEVLHEDAHLEVRSIENKGDGVVIVKVAAAPGADKALIHTDFTQMYEFANKALAGYQQQLAIQSTHINQLLGIVSTSQEVQKLMAEQRSGDNYYGNINAVNFTPYGTATGGVYNDFSNTQDLAQAAAQIQALLAQLQQQGHSPESAQQQVANDLAEQAKQDPTTLGRLMMWGQKLGDATITDVVKGVVKMALRAAGVPLP